MQATKDTMLAFLATRLTSVNPKRTVTIDGVARPAVLVCENERAEAKDAFNEAYCMEWGEAKIVGDGSRPLETVDCTISYHSMGCDEDSGADRGRVIGTMDAELKQMLEPRKTAKLDLCKCEGEALGTKLFWSDAKFEAPEYVGKMLRRRVQLKVYFYPEVGE